MISLCCKDGRRAAAVRGAERTRCDADVSREDPLKHPRKWGSPGPILSPGPGLGFCREAGARAPAGREGIWHNLKAAAQPN